MRMTLEEVVLKWGSYFLEDDDQVYMTQSEHKEFAKDCLKAEISALEVYEYLNI